MAYIVPSIIASMVVVPSTQNSSSLGFCLRSWHSSCQSSLTVVVGQAPKLGQSARALSLIIASFFTYFTLAISHHVSLAVCLHRTAMAMCTMAQL